MEMEYCVCNKMGGGGNDRFWQMQVVCTDEDARNGRKEQCICCGMYTSSLCVRWRDWLGYLASISRTALGACCGGANDWASRAEPLPASAVGEHACRENWVQGEVHYNMAVLLFNPHSHIQNSWEFRTLSMWCEAFRWCSVFFWKGMLWKVYLAASWFFYALLYVFSHISNGLWQLVEPFRGKLIRDKFKICRQRKIGVTAISSPSDRLASQ